MLGNLYREVRLRILNFPVAPQVHWSRLRRSNHGNCRLFTDCVGQVCYKFAFRHLAWRHGEQLAIFDYIEVFYNPKRKHSDNGMLSPVSFERQQKMRAEGV